MLNKSGWRIQNVTKRQKTKVSVSPWFCFKKYKAFYQIGPEANLVYYPLCPSVCLSVCPFVRTIAKLPTLEVKKLILASDDTFKKKHQFQKKI